MRIFYDKTNLTTLILWC